MRDLSEKYAPLIYKFLAGASEVGPTMKVTVSENSYPSMYQKVTEEKFIFYHEKLSKTSEAYYLEVGLYSSITYFVEAMNTLIQDWTTSETLVCQLKLAA